MARSTMLTVLLGAIAAAAVMVALSGCSGAGSTAATVSGASVKALATEDVTAARTLKCWLTVMYRGQRGGTGIRASIRPKQTTDSGTNSDGSTYTYYWDDNDLSGHAEYTWPDGSWRHLVWGLWLTEPNGMDTRIDFTETWSDGTTMSYTCYTLTVGNDYSEHTAGTAQVPGGGTVQFAMARRLGGDSLNVAFSDGTTMTLTTHTRVISTVTIYALDFAAGATGTITGPGGTQDFTLEGVNTDASSGYWTRMNVTSADGSKAQFELGVGFTGSGQIALAGELLGSLNWDTGSNGTLRQVGTDAVAVAPTEVARRFAMDRFIYSTSAMSPGATW